MLQIPSSQLRVLIKRAFSEAFRAKGFVYVSAAFTLLVFAALIARFGVSLGIVALGAIAVVAFSLLLILVGAASKLTGPALAWPVRIIIWVVAICFSVSLVLILSSVFFNTPIKIRDWLIAQLGSHSNRVALVEEETKQHVAAPVTKREIRTIIISETETPPTQPTVRLADFLSQERPHVGYHFIVDRAGVPYPFADLNDTLFHTRGHNDDSIAIGLEHQEGERFPPAQIAGLTALLKNLTHRFKLSPQDVFSKQEVAPESPRDISRYMNAIRRTLSEASKT
jgi:hypothetical protein